MNAINLRRFMLKDIEDFHKYAKVEGVGEMAGWSHHKSIEESFEILKKFIDDDDTFAICLDEMVIGSISFHKSWANEIYPELNIKEIGYVLSKDFWGNGIMLEAIKMILKYGFELMRLDAITVCHFLSNYQSKRVIEKSKFVYVRDDMFYQTNQMEKQYIMYKKDYCELY